MPIAVPIRDPCPYCENFEGRPSASAGPPAIVYETPTACCSLNPSSHGGMPGHALVIPRRHVELIVDLSDEETTELALMVATASRVIRDRLDPDGILVVQRNGLDAEQTVPHVHFHVIPRRAGTPWPPTTWIETTPQDERQALAAELAGLWPAP